MGLLVVKPDPAPTNHPPHSHSLNSNLPPFSLKTKRQLRWAAISQLWFSNPNIYWMNDLRTLKYPIFYLDVILMNFSRDKKSVTQITMSSFDSSGWDGLPVGGGMHIFIPPRTNDRTNGSGDIDQDGRGSFNRGDYRR